MYTYIQYFLSPISLSFLQSFDKVKVSPQMYHATVGTNFLTQILFYQQEIYTVITYICWA